MKSRPWKRGYNSDAPILKLHFPRWEPAGVQTLDRPQSVRRKHRPRTLPYE